MVGEKAAKCHHIELKKWSLLHTASCATSAGNGGLQRSVRGGRGRRPKEGTAEARAITWRGEKREMETNVVANKW